MASNYERDKIIYEKVEEGVQLKEIAREFKITVPTVKNVYRIFKSRLEDESNPLLKVLNYDLKLHAALQRFGFYNNLDVLCLLYEEDNDMEELKQVNGLGDKGRQKIIEYISKYHSDNDIDLHDKLIKFDIIANFDGLKLLRETINSTSMAVIRLGEEYEGIALNINLENMNVRALVRDDISPEKYILDFDPDIYAFRVEEKIISNIIEEDNEIAIDIVEEKEEDTEKAEEEVKDEHENINKTYEIHEARDLNLKPKKLKVNPKIKSLQPSFTISELVINIDEININFGNMDNNEILECLYKLLDKVK